MNEFTINRSIRCDFIILFQKRKMFYLPSKIILALLFFIFAANAQILQIGQDPLTAYSSAKGDSTYYLFSFSLSTGIKNYGAIAIEFPPEFETGLISSPSPECGYMSSGEYIAVSCLITSRTFKLSLGNIQPGNYQIIVGQVQNPSTYEASGSFKIYSFQSEAMVEYNENFGKISFTAPPSPLF